MKINEFISNYKNHPILFVGTGVSLRYLNNSFNWNGLLEHVIVELKGNKEFYLNTKSKCQEDGKFRFDKIASIIENEFSEALESDRNGRFKDVNDIFFEKMEKDINVGRFKIYISKLLENLEYREEKKDEIKELKKIRKNIGSIVTTNYDKLIEDIFEFEPLIGNDILLSNPYGSVYKIHGCVTQPEQIIITKEDYDKFNNQYELIRAQLLSLFIHNPIIFLGYNIGDQNIKNILKTIFTYAKPNSELAEIIRKNFLLVEYEANSNNEDITEHDIDLEGFSTIRINKLKTDNYISIYKSLSEINLPISAMDIRKVQNVVKEIYSGGKIKVSITEKLDNLKNGDKVLVIGTDKTIRYEHQSSSEIMANYFKIIDEENSQLLDLIDKITIQRQQYFPMFAFCKINNRIDSKKNLREQQKSKVIDFSQGIKGNLQKKYNNVKAIQDDNTISRTNKVSVFTWNIMNDNINLSIVEDYLRKYENKECTDYRKLLCVYDYKKYSEID